MKILSYIDFRTLFILFSLMCVVEGLSKLGVLRYFGDKLVNKCRSTRILAFALVFLCFFSSMLMTNDVALITFVPFAIFVYKMIDKEKDILYVVVLQTIAANLGSMLTPMGNPQNLYLYNLSKLNIIEFFKIIGPYSLASLFMLCIALFFIKNVEIDIKISATKYDFDKKRLYAYIGLFVICMFSVLRIFTATTALLMSIIIVFCLDKDIFKKIDYQLLLTFLVLFIVIGLIRNIKIVNDFLHSIIKGHEVLVSILTSQVISNVPAAILLSGFTDNYRDLIIGTNLGGLGTLIASMASLISFKKIITEYKNIKSKYIFVFTLANLVFLVILIMLNRVL